MSVSLYPLNSVEVSIPFVSPTHSSSIFYFGKVQYKDFIWFLFLFCQRLKLSSMALLPVGKAVRVQVIKFVSHLMKWHINFTPK